MHRNKALLFALFFCFSFSLFGQNQFRMSKGVDVGDTTQLHELILINYSSLLGNCIEVNNQEVVFMLRNSDEPTLVPVDEVRYLGVYFDPSLQASSFRKSQSISGELGFAAPTYHRTALPWKGKGQVRIINVVYSVAEFNWGKNFQFGIGTTLLFSVMTTQNLRFSLGENLNIGLAHQAIYPIIATDVDNRPLAGDLGGNLSVGNSDRWLNLGAGILYSTESDLRPAHINLSAGGKVGRNWHLYGEVSVIDDRFDVLILPAFSAAQTIRRHRWRFGVFNIIAPFDGPLLPLPLIGYEYHW